MKHLTRQEAIGRMMLAQANLINLKFRSELLWTPSWARYVLIIYLHKDDERPQLPILMHPDFKSIVVNLDEANYCVKYTWDSETAAL